MCSVEVCLNHFFIDVFNINTAILYSSSYFFYRVNKLVLPTICNCNVQIMSVVSSSCIIKPFENVIDGIWQEFCSPHCLNTHLVFVNPGIYVQFFQSLTDKFIQIFKLSVVPLQIFSRENIQCNYLNVKLLTPIQKILYSICSPIVTILTYGECLFCPPSVAVQNYCNVFW